MVLAKRRVEGSAPDRQQKGRGDFNREPISRSRAGMEQTPGLVDFGLPDGGNEADSCRSVGSHLHNRLGHRIGRVFCSVSEMIPTNVH